MLIVLFISSQGTIFLAFRQAAFNSKKSVIGLTSLQIITFKRYRCLRFQVRSVLHRFICRTRRQPFVK